MNLLNDDRWIARPGKLNIAAHSCTKKCIKVPEWAKQHKTIKSIVWKEDTDPKMYREMYCKFPHVAHDEILEIAISMASLELPAYVLSWIIDYLPIGQGTNRVMQINIFQGVFNSRRNLKQ